MKPRTFFFAAIVDTPNATVYAAAPVLCLPLFARELVSYRQAFDIAALEVLASGFGLFFVEPGEAGAIIC